MDSITQAALGGLCGELILSKKIGWKGAAWGVTFGTIPDLDIIGFAWQSYSEQLSSHRGLSHSLMIMPVAAIFFGWIISLIHGYKEGKNGKKKYNVSFKRAALFVFVAWSTHSLIDCFNSYGTQIFEPFYSYRFSFDNMFIIDLFFTVPILIGLVWTVFLCKGKRKLRVAIGWLTTTWLCFYVAASFTMKFYSKQHFYDRLNHWGVTPIEMRTTPTLSNIFLWRMVARDDEKYYVGYWSLFDKPGRKYPFVEFEHGHHLEKELKSSEDFQTIKWFCGSWRKTYQIEGEEDTYYVAAMMIGEMHIPKENGYEFKPAFIWKFKKKGEVYELDGRFKMSKDGYGDMNTVLASVISRVSGGNESWMKGKWIWDEKKK